MEKIILAILYAIIGTILSIPYCWLAGWDDSIFPLMIMFLPILVLIWFMFGMTDEVFQYNGRRSFRLNWNGIFFMDDKKPVLFWLFTLYILFPIVLNRLSLYIDMLGYQSLSSRLYEFRYGSLIIIPLVSILTIIFILIILEIFTNKKIA